MSIPAIQTEHELRDLSEAIRAEALFASTLQPSEQPSDELVRETVAATLRRLGAGTCAAMLAAEYGDHPECAVARMAWARATISRAYPAPELYGDRATAAPPCRPRVQRRAA